MQLLLDTHIYLWCIKDDRHLSKKSRSIILEADEVYVSSASVWEAVIKIKLGKLTVSLNELVKAITKSGFIELPITAKHALKVSRLPDFHRDPFDRILIAQAISEKLTLMTVDSEMKAYFNLVEIV